MTTQIRETDEEGPGIVLRGLARRYRKNCAKRFESSNTTRTGKRPTRSSEQLNSDEPPVVYRHRHQ